MNEESAINLKGVKSRRVTSLETSAREGLFGMDRLEGSNPRPRFRKTTYREKKNASWLIVNRQKRHLLNFSYIQYFPFQ